MGNMLRNQLDIWATAWTYYLRLPLPALLSKRLRYSQQSLEKSIVYFPLFGIFIGAVSGLVFLVADTLLEHTGLAILLSMTASIIMTGAMHEDGLADFFDAFGGGWWSKERILEIMKDSRLGTFGAAALLLALLLKYQGLAAIDARELPVVLIAAHALSRFAAGAFIYTHEYVRENDASYFKPMIKERMARRDFVLMAVFGTVPMLLLGSAWYLLLIPAVWIMRLAFGHWFLGKIGGFTGDCLGATQQITELCFYIGYIAITVQL